MEEISNACDTTKDVKGNCSTIAEFLAGKNIFITGGTGFLGTVLIERLLSATPDIGNIYVLIRAKNGYSADSRIARLMSKVVSIAQESSDDVPKNDSKFCGWGIQSCLLKFE